MQLTGLSQKKQLRNTGWLKDLERETRIIRND